MEEKTRRKEGKKPDRKATEQGTRPERAGFGVDADGKRGEIAMGGERRARGNKEIRATEEPGLPILKSKVWPTRTDGKLNGREKWKGKRVEAGGRDLWKEVMSGRNRASLWFW